MTLASPTIEVADKSMPAEIEYERLARRQQQQG